MTYLESYRLCKTKEELVSKVNKDAHFAIIVNHDRIPPIEKAMTIVAEERGWDLDGCILNEK